MKSQHPNISSSAVRQGWHFIMLAIVLLLACLSSGAQAAWESGVAGESTLAVSNGPNVLALAKSARVLAIGQDNKVGVTLLNPDSGADIASISLSAKPIGLALSDDGSVIYALLQGSSDVSVISAVGSGQLKTIAIQATWPVGGKPVALLADQQQKRLYVADKEGRLLEFDLDTGAILRTLTISGKPVRLALVSGAPLLLVGTRSGDILTVNLTTLTVTKTMPIGSQIDGLLWWDTDSLALVLPKNKDQWMLVDPVPGLVDTAIALEGSANRLAVDVQGGNAFIATQDDISVNLIDLKQSLNQGRHLLVDKPGDVVFDPSAKVLYTSLPLADKLLRLDPLQAKWAVPLSMRFRYRDVAVHQSQGQAYAVTERLKGLLSRWRLSDRFRSVLPLNAGARKIAIDPASNLAVLGLITPSDEIGFVDLSASSPKLLVDRIKMGAEIIAIATDPARKRSLVLTDSSQGIRVLDNTTRKQLEALNTTEVYRALAVHSGMGAAFLLSQTRRLATFDLTSLTITSSMELDFEPGNIAVDENLRLAVISSPKENALRVIDLNSMTFVRSINLARHPGGVAVHPDFSQAVVASQESDLLSLVDLKDDKASVQEFTGVSRPLALAISTSTNQALVLSGEKDDLLFVNLPNPKPLLSNISPIDITSGSPALVLKVQGSRFTKLSSVLWGSTVLTTRYVDSRSLEADVPATLVNTSGEVPVIVRNPQPGGGDSNPLTFTVKAPVPVLSSITPNTLKANSTDQIISLAGQYFLASSYVLFNNQKIPTTYVSGTKLDATVPGSLLALAGNATVAVFTPLGGTSSSLQVQLTSTAPVLAISGINPDHGQPGTQVIITGTGFNPEAIKNTVKFASDAVANITAASATQLTTVVPTNAQSGAISVTNSLGVATGPLFTINRDQDLNLTASPATIGLLQGSSSALSIQLASSGSQNFIGLASLSASGLPTGVTAKFEPAYLTANQPGVLRLLAGPGAATGTFPITLTAMANLFGVDQPRTANVNVNVQANSGVTGVKGRFVTPAGDGIPDVRVNFDTKTAITDSAGNFLLTGLPSGKVELRFDATEAHPLYPIWPNMVNLSAGQIRVYDDWIINPPPSEDKFKPIITSSQSQSITDERYPGLAITIPAGVTIIGWDGVKKDRIAVERLDPDRLPVAPPPIATNSVYQLYFGTPMGGVPSAPIPVTLPNDIDLNPGEKTNLWYYDGSPMGGTGEWKVGGTGTASADGKVIVSDAGTGIPRFCGVCGLPCFEKNQNSQPATPTLPKGLGEPPAKTCKPVRLATGQETPSETDLYVTSVVDLVAHRSFSPYDPYNNIAGTVLSLGFNWILNYDITLLNLSTSLARLIEPGNIRTDFTPDGHGGFKTTKNSTFDGAILKQDGNGWILTLSEGSQWRFARFGVAGLQYLVEQRDPAGNTLTILRGSDGRIQNATSGLRTMHFSYGANGFVTSVEDDIGRKVQYAYNADNRITQVTAPDGGVTSYTYQDDTSQHVTKSDGNGVPQQTPPPDPCIGFAPNPPLPYRIKTITNPGKTTPITMYYSKSGRVLRQVMEDGLELKFSYKLTGACAATVGGEYLVSGEDWAQNQAGQTITRPGVVVETTITDALGNSNTQRFNNAGLATETVDSQGQKVVYTRDLNGRITAIKDTIGRTIHYAYDANGNRTRTTDPDGRFTDYTFDPKWNTIASVTQYMDNGDKVTGTIEYDPNTGRMLKSTDALGNATRYTYTSSGEVKTIADPLGNVITLNYSPEGDLVSLKDPVGNTATISRDLAGRITQATDPLGFSSQSSLSPIDQVTQVADPMGGTTQINYRADRNLGSVVNPLGTTIESYDYDPADRLTKKTDSQGKASIFAYDAAGRLASATDRKGQMSTLAYDAGGRVTKISLPGGATRYFTYDAVGRLIALEEKGGTSPSRFEYVYDNRDLLTQETIHQQGGSHVITYQYDALGRRSARKLDNFDTTAYSYDKAGRVISIKFNNEVPVSYEWDAASRLTVKTLSNGVRMEYQYDAAGHLLGITYRKSDNTVINNIAYSYDAKGQRISKTTALPSRDETPFTATYDAADRMLTFTLTSSGETFNLAYDDNGNLLNKTSQTTGQATTYTWNTRNWLTAITAPGLTASFAYDALGRRIEKTVNGQSVGFLYDGNQVIAELAGNTINVKLLSGVAVDEMLTRYSTAGARHYLTDALGSVVAMLKDDASVQNYYAYSPYGETTPSASDDGNSSEYTGRENDLTGTYYYRARYFDPVLKRFISADPIGMAGGLNFYQYVGGNPVTRRDPLGLWFGADDIAFMGVGAVVGIVGRFVGDLLTGTHSTLEDYAGAATGGALGGETLLYTANPFLAGAVGGLTGNLTTQALKNLSGKQCDFDAGSALFDTVVGAATGYIPAGPRIIGINAGQGSNLQVFRQILTKAGNGTINNVSPQTAVKMSTGAFYQYAVGQGAAAGAVGSTIYGNVTQ